VQRPARPALQWLTEQSGFRDLAEHVRRLEQLQADLEHAAPVKGLTVNGLQNGTLVLTTASAALAAKLRQTEPSILAGLTRAGWQISRIKIRPQPHRQVVTPPAERAVPRSPAPAAALEALSARAGQTQGALSQALARLSRNQQRRRG